jgi:hypothetical protein
MYVMARHDDMPLYAVRQHSFSLFVVMRIRGRVFTGSDANPQLPFQIEYWAMEMKTDSGRSCRPEEC